MRTILGYSLVALLCLGSGLCADDKKDEKIDTKKLIGKWKPKKEEKGEESVIEFQKDGKWSITTTADGKKDKLDGTYKVDGKKLGTTLKLGGEDKTHTLTITKLTDTELVLVDEKGREDPLVRVK